VRRRINALKGDIENIKKQRTVNRDKRKKNNIPVLALVGYTNAGKSSLLNYLTDAGVKAENKLFATLDPVTRRVRLGDTEALLTDTVGFIQQLPHTLVTAFRATMEEAVYADLLIHVVDAAHENIEEQIRTVHKVLEDIGCKEKPVLHAFNKADLLQDPLDISRFLSDYQPAVLISAATGQGVDELIRAASELLPEPAVAYRFTLKQEDGSLLNKFYQIGNVSEVEYGADGINGLVVMPARLAGQYRQYLIGDGE
jgi:GTP-binding protein HflX